jgi:hypothetical protein
LNDLLKELSAYLRTLGFKGSGQNFRKVEDEFVFIINIQGSRTGSSFFVNLGAQPTFIPAECDSSLPTLKEYECAMRRRVGKENEWSLDKEARVALMRDIEVAQNEFFGLVRTLRRAISHDSVDELMQKFCLGATAGRGALHLARAAAFLGHATIADALVERGLRNAGEHAVGLIHDLQAVRQEINAK